jgi:hypothetical protein
MLIKRRRILSAKIVGKSFFAFAKVLLFAAIAKFGIKS